MSPFAIDLFCGLGGWAEGLLAENWRVVGFDIERHSYGAHRYPAQLVLQDVLTLHGSQFRDAALIVASPPCQVYSWMAMPWSRAKAKAGAIRADGSGKMLADLNRLFDVCFRIQAQASLAAGRHIPMVVENVRGAQPWVGRARWNFGSYYLWGDVHRPSPLTLLEMKSVGNTKKVPGFRFDGVSHGSFQSASVKSSSMNWSDRSKRGQDFSQIAGSQAAGVKLLPGGGAEGWSGANLMRQHHSASLRRKEASALIAKIPLPLARHIGAMFRPQ